MKRQQNLHDTQLAPPTTSLTHSPPSPHPLSPQPTPVDRSAGTQASNPLFDAFGIGKAVGDKLGGNVTHQANQALNQAVTGVVHKVNDTVAPIKAKVESVYKTVNDTLAPVQEHIEKNVLGPVRGVVKSVADGVQAKVDQATKLVSLCSMLLY
jgi:hypothetical protein